MAAKIHKRIGKAQAREEFSTLIQTVSNGGGPVKITDYGKVAAVLVSEQEYAWLCANAKNAPPKRDPRGLFVLSDAAALEDASREIAAEFENSIKKTASKL